jgi:formamidopyrimidine-DNA glycosylase
MPELPEVESVRRQLAPRIEGRRIRSVTVVPQLRFSDVELAAESASCGGGGSTSSRSWTPVWSC